MQTRDKVKLVKALSGLPSTTDDATIYFIGNKKLHNIMMKYKNITCYERINTEIIQDVLNTIENNNILFLKGSHSINLGMFLEYLKQYND